MPAPARVSCAGAAIPGKTRRPSSPGRPYTKETAPMRAEIEAIAEEIKQTLELLRRHL